MIPSRTLIVVLLTAVLAVPCVSHAEFWDGYKLKEFADADDRIDFGNFQPTDFQEAGTLRGFVVGVHDAVDGVRICAPTVKVGQIVGIVKKYVRDNPDKWNRPAATLVVNALSTAYPCKK